MRILQKKLLKDSHFVIYNASAGSGKTYALTKQYLLLLLSGNSSVRFKRMLAITFTNKAVGEMKSRILDNLFKFSRPNILENKNPMFQELCSETALSPQQMQKRCAFLLKQILHNYAFFEISTIDKFNHKIIKTFSRDLQLSQNFEVELDVDSLLERAIANVLDQTGKNQDLTKALLDFSLEKIDENKSWNIQYDLMESGKLLFQENHSNQLESLADKSIADFKNIQNTIDSYLESIEKKASLAAKSALQKIAEAGFLASDFPRKTLPNHFSKILDGERQTKALYNNKLGQNLEEGTILKANDTRDASELSLFLFEQYTIIKNALYQSSFLRNVYANMAPLTVLNEISKELKKLEKDEDLVPISTLNQLISKEIKDQPVPFIYERLGEKYRHYFIDEFQDTSKVQWENLVPLVSNALESQGNYGEHGSLFLVGDVKQAIYRWRGGSTEQFLNLLGKQENPFMVTPTLKSLETNWRSYSEIISFNNTFFSLVGQSLQDNAYRTLFLKSCTQKPNASTGGYVNISFVEGTSEEKKEAYCLRILDIITDLNRKGHSYSDICILIRDNIKGALLATFLSQHQIPIISSDSLLLSHNSTVSFLISLLKMIDNPKDKNFTYEVLLFLSKRLNIEDVHEFLTEHLDAPKALLLQKFGFALDELETASTFEILETAIIQFNLAEGAEAYITFLMDEVLEWEKQNDPSISTFLERWEHKKTTLSISAPESLDAVKIMTIHKAKGLEFPIVIFPFADAVINDGRKKKKIWVNTHGLEMDFGVDNILMNFRSEMLNHPKSVRQAYLEEEHKTQMDAMNVLYVALTRAEKAMYIISERTKTLGSMENASSYAHLFQWFLTDNGMMQEHLNEYEFGLLPEASLVTKDKSTFHNIIPYITRPFIIDDFPISTIQGQLWDTQAGNAIEMGNLVHHVLAKITYADEVAKVLDQLEYDGILEENLLNQLTKYVKDTIEHPLLHPYFTSKYTIYNEQEILTSQGENLRPDRIAISDGYATILDFKTGKPSHRHNTQLLQYSHAIEDMGFSIKSTIIVYIGEEIEPHFL